MDWPEYLETVQVELIIAILFTIIGFLISKIFSPIFGYLFYKRTREYPNGLLNRTLTLLNNNSNKLLTYFWLKDVKSLNSDYYKYDIIIAPSSSSVTTKDIHFKKSKISNLKINGISVVTAKLKLLSEDTGLYESDDIDLIGYIKPSKGSSILFLEERHNNYPILRMEKSEFVIIDNLNEKKPLFGHTIRYDSKNNKIIGYQSILSTYSTEDLYDFVEKTPNNFDQIIIDNCKEENTVTL